MRRTKRRGQGPARRRGRFSARPSGEAAALQHRLRESEERLRLASESTGLGTWDYDTVKRVLLLSERASDLFGMARGATPDGFERFLERVHPEDRERLAGEFAAFIAPGGGPTAEMEYRILLPDGRVRWVRTMARAFRGRGAEAGPSRLIGTVIDVTDARKRQLAEREQNRELERRVKERTAQLNLINKELETFVYSASHDLRAPLRKISAFTQAIERGDSRLTPEDRGYFDRIRAATAHMHRLMDDMLNLTKVARKPLSVESCDLGALAADVARGLKLREPGREVEFVIASGILVEGDRELLSLALRNLLENAWKFTSRHPRARIEFGAARVDGRAAYFVKDDGAGFDMQYAHRLFGAFRRLHAEHEFSGTGVGLGIVERIIRRHGGRIWAEAKVEKGAIFYFTLHTEEP